MPISDDRAVARDATRAQIIARESDVEAWIDLNMEAQAFIVFGCI